MRIRLSAGQRFPIENNLVLLPINSGWSLLLLQNSGHPVFNFMKNSPLSGMFTYRLKPKSSYSTYTNQGYSNLKVKAEIVYGATATDWLNIDSDWFPVSNYTVANQYNYKDLVFYFVPQLTVPVGNHTAIVRFKIEGVKNNITEVLSVYEIIAKLNVFEDGFYYYPSSFNFYNNPGSSTYQPQELQVGGENWTITAPSGLKLTGAGVVSNPDNTFSVSGTGYKSFSLLLNNNINDVLDDNETLILPVVIAYENSSLTIPVTVIQAGEYYPQQVFFQIQNGNLDDDFKMIHLNRTDAYTVESPANIGYEMVTIGTNKKLKVFIIDPSAYGVGNFSNVLSLVYPDAVYNVAINISVGNQFDLGLNFDTVFTHSMKDLEFTTNNIDSYINLELSVVGSQNGFVYEFPFFKGSAKKNIGKALTNFVNYQETQPPVNITFNSSLEGVFPLHYFNLNVKERKNDVDLLTFSKSNVPFILGYKPKIADNKAILQHNNFSRFTSKSFALINVFSQVGFFDYVVKKNNITIASVLQSFGYIRTVKLDFSAHNAVPGDIFDFILFAGAEEIKKSFVIFPETEQSISVVYIDSFGLQSCLNFTGQTKTVNSEFNFKLENYLGSHFLHTRKFVEKESSTIVLNTGFLLESQSLEIAELMKSEKAWIVINDEKRLEIIPKTEKLRELDKDAFLYDYQIEFEINKKSYAQDYNF